VRLFKSDWSVDERVKLVLYEDLVREPIAALQEIGGFLNESFTDEIVESRSWSDVSNISADSLSDRRGLWLREHFGQVLKPITEESIDKWKTGLTRLEVELVESGCAEGMDWLGYERAARGAADLPSRFKLASAQAWGSLFWSSYEVRRRCRLALKRSGSEPGATW
jgi:hypothetical protein